MIRLRFLQDEDFPAFHNHENFVTRFQAQSFARLSRNDYLVFRR